MSEVNFSSETEQPTLCQMFDIHDSEQKSSS